MNGLRRWTSNSPASVLLTILLLAMALRIVFSFLLFPRLAEPLGMGEDPDNFWQLAKNWVDGKGYVAYDGGEVSTLRGPGYVAVLAGVYILFGNQFAGAVVVQCLISTLLCLPVYYLGKRIYGQSTGYLAALVVALHPLLIWYSPRMRYEYLFALVLSMAVLWTLKFRASGSIRDAILTGIFYGLASLTNQVSVLLPFGLFAVILVFERYRVKLAKRSLLALAIMAAVILPWTIRNYQVTGRLILVHTGGVTNFVKGNFEFEHYDEAPLQSVKLMNMGDEMTAQVLGFNKADVDIYTTGWDEALTPYAVAYVREHPGMLLNKILAQTPRFWYLSESRIKSYGLGAIQGVLLLFALAGLFRNRGRKQGTLLLLIVIAYFNLAYAATHVEGRYATPVVPLVIVLGTAGMQTVWDYIQSWRRKGAAPELQPLDGLSLGGGRMET